MNTPWKVSEQQSSALPLPGAAPIPLPGLFATSDAIDVRGYDWVEFTVKVSGNIGVDPVTQLEATFQYGEATGPLAGEWTDVTSESVDAQGVAPQTTYNPTLVISGGAATWRIPVPVHGQQMRIVVGASNGTPDAGSQLVCYAYRRSF